MVSLSMGLTTGLVRWYRRPQKLRWASGAALEAGAGRLPAPVPSAMRRRYAVSSRLVGGLSTVVIEPARAMMDLVYLPGGAHVSPPARYHWWLIDRLARWSGARVWVPTWPLAPQHSLSEALPQLGAFYRVVAATPGRFGVVGDSSGGGLALVAGDVGAGPPGTLP